MKHIYRVSTHEILDAGKPQERQTLTDIIEFESDLELVRSGKNVFHLLDDYRERVAPEVEVPELRYRLSDLEVLDCGDPDTLRELEGLRYEVRGVETHPDDTSRVASVHIASCFSREMAELIVKALRAYCGVKEVARG